MMDNTRFYYQKNKQPGGVISYRYAILPEKKYYCGDKAIMINSGFPRKKDQ